MNQGVSGLLALGPTAVKVWASTHRFIVRGVNLRRIA
jgi:hypothetical protein